MNHSINDNVNILKWEGALKLSRPLEDNHYQYLYAFASTLRVIRDLSEDDVKEDYIRNNVKLPFGKDQEFYVGAFSKSFQNQKNSSRDKKGSSVPDYYALPKTQPSSWCCWKPSLDKSELIIANNNHNLANSYNCFETWLNYLIENFIQPWGYSLDGKMRIFKGFDNGKRVLTVKDNQVSVTDLEIFS